MHIGILQCGHASDGIRSDGGDFSEMFQNLLGSDDMRYTTWNVVDMDFPKGPGAADAWLITGSKHGVYEDHPFIAPLEKLIRAIHAEKRPLVGICFGHQIVAQALGGRVVKYPGGWVVGRHIYDWGGEAIRLNAWHQDQVVERPAGSRAIAASAHCEHAALAYGDHILTIQPHPEFSANAIAGLIAERGDGVPQALLRGAEATLGLPTDSGEVASRMRAVLRGGMAPQDA